MCIMHCYACTISDLKHRHAIIPWKTLYFRGVWWSSLASSSRAPSKQLAMILWCLQTIVVGAFYTATANITVTWICTEDTHICTSRPGVYNLLIPVYIIHKHRQYIVGLIQYRVKYVRQDLEYITSLSLPIHCMESTVSSLTKSIMP